MRTPFLIFAAAALFVLPAAAATVSNCDEVPHTVTVNNAGEVKEYTLPVGGTIESTGPMVSIRVGTGEFIRTSMRDVYCIRKGNLSLQMRRTYSNKRQ